tara:strand:+ start:8651 stop:9706 length:1056 start_codon:yes stop_codon:yes gene_type:complete
MSKVSALLLQKSLLQNNLLNDISHKDSLFNELNPTCNKTIIIPSDFKDADNTTILNSNLQHRQNEINFKTNKTLLVNQPYNTLSKDIAVNPFFKNNIKKFVNIDTRFRENYSSTISTDFTMQLNFSLKNVISMELVDIEIPNTWYTISESLGNNFFYINDTKIMIQSGNYDGDLLMDEIKKNVNFTGYDIQMNFVSGQCEISKLNAIDTIIFSQCNDDDISIQRTLGWILGFRKNEYTGAQSHISEGIIDTAGKRYIYVIIDDFNNNVNDFIIGNLKTSFLNKNILGRVSFNETKYQIIRDTAADHGLQTREYFGPVNINRLHVQLIDEYGKTIDLNHMDFSFALQFKLMY